MEYTSFEQQIKDRLENGFANWNGGEAGARVIEGWALSDSPLSAHWPHGWNHMRRAPGDSGARRSSRRL